MNIIVNGLPREFRPGLTVGQLLDQDGYGGRRVAVEINGEIVPKSQHAEHALASGDQVEVVQAIGGG
ncbi:MAG: thiamine biosynthesis protein ThiS [Nevskia sp.]|nr:thiamine biosynthesis protein ThiS [Nevskia sp.]